MIFKIIWNEIKKEFFTAWSYKWQWLGELFSLLIFFTFLSIITKKIESGMAYCIWFYSILIIGEVSSKVSSEMRTGTFEQLYLSSISSTIIFMSKAIASILRASILVIILLMIFWTLGIVTNGFLKIKLLGIMLVTSCGLFGMSLLMGGITILFKDSAWLLNIVNNSILFLSGIFLPINVLPNYFQTISELFPTTHAINMFNRIEPLYFGDWTIMFFLNFLYFIVGFACFTICEKQAKKIGILNQY